MRDEIKRPANAIDPDAPASAEEVRAAEALRVALERKSDAFVESISAAHSPKEIDLAEHRAIVERAIARPTPKTRSRVIRVTFGVAAALSLAAAWMLFVRSSARELAASPVASAPSDLEARPKLVEVHSTENLFAHVPASRDTRSTRIDRIAMARENDLRENQFATWGVR